MAWVGDTSSRMTNLQFEEVTANHNCTDDKKRAVVSCTYVMSAPAMSHIIMCSSCDGGDERNF